MEEAFCLWRSLKLRLLGLGMIFGLSLLFCSPALALTNADFQAMIESVSVPSSMTPGQSGTATITVKNIGAATWKASGTNYFSVYRYDATNHVETVSAFAAGGWRSNKQPMILPVASVSPGASVTFAFPITAPSVAGHYQEGFILCAENIAWIKTGKFTLDVQISGTPVTTTSPPPASTPVTEPVLAEGTTDWAAQLVEPLASEYQIDPGEHITQTLAFKNVGTKTWTNDGGTFVSLYAVDGKKERTSQFKDLLWLSASHPVKLKETSVKPGQIGHIVLELRAPMAPGSYKETFAMAAENAAWVSGSNLTFPIKVPMTTEFVATAPPGSDMITSVPDTTTQAKHDGSYTALLMLRSAQALTLLGNGSQQLTFGFKNIGKATWGVRSVRIKGVTPLLSGNLSSVRDQSWQDPAEPVRVKGQTNPGEIGFLTFKIKAPAKRGTYLASFVLQADSQAVDGGELDIPITVTADGYIEPTPSSTPSPSTPQTPSVSAPLTNLAALGGDTSSLPSEPNIRVGLYKTTDNQATIRAKYAPVSVLTSNGSSAICHLAINESTTVSFDRTNRVYKLSGGPCSGQSTDYYRFRADDGVSAMEISDYSRPVGWLPGANDNTFRAQLELRYTPSTDSVWVINELPFEWYLKGIGETSNSSPMEYQRALLTAARTYAYYHIKRGTKHANEYYIVDAHLDQVYRGYGAELRDDRVVQAVNDTRGQIVTYNGQLAITPYYSRSDGRTRAWTEVWGGGPYPWLVSVSVPWDQGKTLWGHGVGLSATGAIGAANDGKTYDQILKWFYTGIQLMIAYK